MRQLSLKISDALYDQLILKAKAMGQLKMSDALRILLQESVQSPRVSSEHRLHRKLLHYQVTTYYMLQAHLINNFDKGLELNEQAHDKAKKVLQTLLKKPKAE